MKKKNYFIGFVFIVISVGCSIMGCFNVYAAIDTPLISITNFGTIMASSVNATMENKKLTYDNIYAKAQSLPINTPVNYILPVNIDTGLQVNFNVSASGYLIGDTIEATVTVKKVLDSELSFSIPLTMIPDGLSIVGDSNIILNEMISSYAYKIQIADTLTQLKNAYKILGKYTYDGVEIDIYTQEFSIEKGQIQFVLEEGLDSCLLENVEVSIIEVMTENTISDKSNGAIVEEAKIYKPNEVDGRVITFDMIPSGRYALVINQDSFPEELTIKEENLVVDLNYANPIVTIPIEKALKPDLEVELTELKPSNVVHNNEMVTMTYMINPKPVTVSAYNVNEITEALFIVDTSSAMTDNHWNQVIEGIQKMITNVNTSLKVGVMGYNSDIVYPTNDVHLPFYSLSNEAEKEAFIKSLQHGGLVPDSNNAERDLSVALEKAEEIISTSTSAGPKVIILISTNQVKFDFNIVQSLQASASDYQLMTLSLESTPANNLSSLKDVHEQLARSNTYFEISNEADFDDVVTKINKILFNNSTTPISEFIVNPTLYFDLGKNFENIEGLEQVQDTLYEIKPSEEIVYQLDLTTNEYKADPVEVSFKVKVINTNPDDIITFGDSTSLVNSLVYEQLDGNFAMKPIVVPTFTVEKVDVALEYGLYGGVSDDKIKIISCEEDGVVKEFIEGSTVNFAAIFEYQPYYTDFSLVVDSKLSVSDENIKVYQVMTDVNNNISLDRIEAINMESY